MSTSVLKALPGKLDIKRHLPSILYIWKTRLVHSKKIKKQDLSALFGDEWITNAEHQINQARQVINRVALTFIPYFEKRVLPLLLDYVAYLSHIKSIDAYWTKT